MHHPRYNLGMMTQQNPQARRLRARPADARTREATRGSRDPQGRPAWAPSWRGIAASVLISSVLPLVFYARLRHIAGSETTALVIAGVIPVAWTLGKWVTRRRLDPIGVLSIVGFAAGIVLVAATGGSPFAFKIRDNALAGLLGVACLASILIRRPLGLPLLRMARPEMSGAAVRTAANRLTAVGGITLLLQATVVIVLAATLPTSTFLAVHEPAGLSIIGLGILRLVWGKRHHAVAQPGGQEDFQPRGGQGGGAAP
jgi:hypothetical protein